MRTRKLSRDTLISIAHVTFLILLPLAWHRSTGNCDFIQIEIGETTYTILSKALSFQILAGPPITNQTGTTFGTFELSYNEVFYAPNYHLLGSIKYSDSEGLVVGWAYLLVGYLCLIVAYRLHRRKGKDDTLQQPMKFGPLHIPTYRVVIHLTLTAALIAACLRNRTVSEGIIFSLGMGGFGFGTGEGTAGFGIGLETTDFDLIYEGGAYDPVDFSPFSIDYLFEYGGFTLLIGWFYIIAAYAIASITFAIIRLRQTKLSKKTTHP